MAIGTTAAILASGAAGLGSAVIGSRSAKRATQAQTNAANQQIALDREIYADQTGRFAPYLESGGNALNAYNFEMGLGDRPDGYRGFQATPGYDFQMQQGTRAIDGSAAASGGLFSGATLKSLQGFGQGLANQEYGNYLNRLSGMAGAGQSAAGMQATAAGNMGQSSGNALASIGNAQSAGAIAQGNAITGGIQNGLSTFGYMQQFAGPRGGQIGTPGVTPGLYGGGR